MPAKQYRRRTATNIMAGSFDPSPLHVIDSGVVITSKGTSGPTQEMRDMIVTGEVRGGKKPKVAQSKARQDSGHAVAESGGGNEKRAQGGDKENAVSGGGAADVLSGVLSSPPLSEPLQPIVVEKERAKASGFWRARSSKSASLGPSLKRKRSENGMSDPSLAEGRPLKQNKILPNDSESLSPVSSSGMFGASSPGSLSSGPSCSSSLIMRSISPDISNGDEPQKLTKADAHKLYEVIKAVGVLCKVCEKVSPTVPYMEMHLTEMHSDRIDMKAVPQRQPKKPRGPRKNIAPKKGWKGWVEDELEPQKLIMLDNPEVLPERTTRSGRKI
ncbi:hypothetical protein BU17DRAFT_98763 [Hysterangium stoloniferum]|nr:hypothetical protein BU17DRAFT_98763 [Hysterangium stoloniferum]